VPDEKGYEYSNWIKEYLLNAPLRIQLDIESVKTSGSPEKSSELLSESGDNFANVALQFQRNNPDGFGQWVEHIHEFLPEFSGVETLIKPENQRRLVRIITGDGARIPQYLLSDGTLRFMVLTLLAFQPTAPRIMLIEEPENGLHPSAIEGVIDPLKTADPDQQVIFASHSPIVLANFKLKDVLVFRKTEFGTELVRGKDHPVLEDWVGDLDTSSLLASGIF
jgi:predicted ATPase